MLKDRWHDLCGFVQQNDGLPTRPVGPWTEKKLYFWNRYIDITTRAMVGHSAWPAGLVYVDLFAGPGVCTLKDSKRRIPGSVLIAAHAPKRFSWILACEKDPDLFHACKSRLVAAGASARSHVFLGDCNESVSQIASAIPDGALTLAFVDPTGLHARFDTIAHLSRRGAVDLLVLFADRHDIVRNVELYDEQGRESNLDQVLGPDSEWRSHWRRLGNQNAENVSKMFAEIYRRQLRDHLGYTRSAEKTMYSAKGPLYRLIYASKHERGLEFWDKITKKDVSGQKDLF